MDCSFATYFHKIPELPQKSALTKIDQTFRVRNVDGRKGWLKLNFSQSKVGWVIRFGEATRGTTRPEKTDRPCEGSLGFGTAKAVVASGAVTVHASTLLAPSQELVARA